MYVFIKHSCLLQELLLPHSIRGGTFSNNTSQVQDVLQADVNFLQIKL